MARFTEVNPSYNDQEAPLLDAARATALAEIVLGHVTREFPHKLDHIMAEAADLGRPRDLHPVFYGSFDWHSCVHGYWCLARLLRRFPDLPAARTIRSLFDSHLTAARIAAECAYFERPSSRGFERPYGWAWLLKLAAELRHFPSGPWSAALAPLASIVARRFAAFLPLAGYPVRAGTHGNTAFALALAADYAEQGSDLHGLLAETAERWYGGDAGCQAWEPGGDDFLSPALIEAEAMRRLLPAGRFHTWFDGFLPRLIQGEPWTLFEPAVVTDRSDGKLAHLDGVNLCRAWCWRALAGALPEGDARIGRLHAASATHLAASLPHIADHYMGSHWLASFALLALDEPCRAVLSTAPQQERPDVHRHEPLQGHQG